MNALVFDPNDLFPLGEFTYAEAKSHSEKVDEYLGLRTEATEKLISLKYQKLKKEPDEQFWIDLPIQTLLTPYVEIRKMLESLELKAGDTVVDLGAGYGRMGFVINRHFSDVKFIGFEKVSERVNEGVRCFQKYGCTNAILKRADLSAPEFEIPEVRAYFIYDYGSKKAIQRTLDQIRDVAKNQIVTVIGRGRATRDLIEQNTPWLSQIVEPKHFQNYSIYSSGYFSS